MSIFLAQLPEPKLRDIVSQLNVLVIGGTAGLGKAITCSLLKRGARVTVVGRREPGPELSQATYISKDLSLMRNARELTEEVELQNYDTILFTNGIFAAPSRQVSEEGIELDMAVSYLSRYVFMKEALKKSIGSKRKDLTRKPRVFVMGFPGAKNEANLEDFNSEREYSALPAHMNTVVANEALVTYVNQQSEGAVNAYGLNPGIIKTEIRDNLLGKNSWKSWVAETLIGWFTPTPEQYAEDQLIHTLVSPVLEAKPGVHINNKRKIVDPNPWLVGNDHVERIIQESEVLVDKAFGSYHDTTSPSSPPL